MTLEQQKNNFNDFVKKQDAIMFKKGNDYANSDRLSNFKLAGTICQLTPSQQCLSLIATKIARLGVLLTGKQPNNESIRDSIIDLSVYSFLLDCLQMESENLPVNVAMDGIRTSKGLLTEIN